jgi:myo-inositol-1(or 4)-monophosphatase
MTMTTRAEQQRALACAVAAARAAGKLLRRHLNGPKRISSSQQHDIKLELDVRSQKLIERALRRGFPGVPILGEEGTLGDEHADARWVVDPIDGTVNFTYGIPHVCISIALQVRTAGFNRHGPGEAKASRTLAEGPRAEDYTTVVGVVYDPFCDELWTAIRGGPARLNGKVIHASGRTELAEAIVSMGFAKSGATLRIGLPVFNRLIRRVRKVRMMGAAALGLVYVASGRFDAYLEFGIKLWDIAAGGLILECAGGDFWRHPTRGRHTYELRAANSHLRRKLERFIRR